MCIPNWFRSCSNEEEFYSSHYINLLSKKHKIIYDPINPQFIFSDSIAKECLNYDCVKILFSGENIRTDYNLVDYTLDYDYMDFGDRHLCVPLFYLLYNPLQYGTNSMDSKNRNIDTQSLRQRNKFCAILVSNGGRKRTLFRNLAFEKLNAYKKVDSGGSWNNNIGYKVSAKITWLRNYKFNICFENSSYPGYLSEKLYEAYISGCIPIYWGDTSLRCHIDSLESRPSNSATNMGGGGILHP